jgi:hypothetical protein
MKTQSGNTLFWIGLLALLAVVGITAAVQADEKAVRKELQTAYNTLAKADMKGDSKTYIALLTSDFKQKYPGGKWDSRESIENEFSLRSRNEKITASFNIGKLTLNGTQAVAMVSEKKSYSEDNPASNYILTVWRATWNKTAQGWRLRLHEQTDRKVYENGKPVG